LDRLRRCPGRGRARVWVNHNRCRWIQQPLGRKLRHRRDLSQTLSRGGPSVDGGVLQTYKPGSVPLPEGRAVTIYLAQPPAVKHLALLQVGFSRRCVTADGRTLLPSDFTLILPIRGGRYVSVPLSVPDAGSTNRNRDLGVTQHPAQRSPDFPPSSPCGKDGGHPVCMTLRFEL